MDTIELTGLVFMGRHGVKHNERMNTQRIQVDATLELELRYPGETDELTDTINYAEVRKIIQEIVETHSYKLLEKMAETIAESLLLRFDTLQRIIIRVAKLDIWPHGFPSITIQRSSSYL